MKYSKKPFVACEFFFLVRILSVQYRLLSRWLSIQVGAKKVSIFSLDYSYSQPQFVVAILVSLAVWERDRKRSPNTHHTVSHTTHTHSLSPWMNLHIRQQYWSLTVQYLEFSELLPHTLRVSTDSLSTGQLLLLWLHPGEKGTETWMYVKALNYIGLSVDSPGHAKKSSQCLSDREQGYLVNCSLTTGLFHSIGCLFGETWF